MTPSSKRKGISRAAYEALVNIGYDDTNRVFVKGRNWKKKATDNNPLAKSFMKEYNEAAVSFNVDKDHQFWTGIGSFKSICGRTAVPLLWGTKKKYVNKSLIEGYILMLKTEQAHLEANSADEIIREAVRNRMLPDLPIATLKLLENYGFDARNYYRDQRHWDNAQAALKNMDVVPSYSKGEKMVLATSVGMKIYYIKYPGIKALSGWILTNPNITEDNVRSAIKGYYDI